ncbi:DUF4340 domain-containing protein [Pleurocapsales cyanobacterium LEGE 06147]|nr:DUF4340 domain-containing protein [Pleurocapsales cyanobacterium LEGE 06147]
MTLKRNTWLLLVLATILGGWVYFYEIRGEAKRTQIQAEQRQIFNFPEEAIAKIIINQPDRTLEFVRTGDSNRPWQMKQPEDVPASDATVSFLVDLLVRGERDRSFTVPVSQLKEYGLDNPQTKITVELDNNQTHQIVLGRSNINDKSLYAQTDLSQNNNNQETEILLVPKNWYYAVERDLEEWKEKELSE